MGIELNINDISDPRIIEIRFILMITKEELLTMVSTQLNRY